MEYSNLLAHTPKANRTSNDRFFSPVRPPQPHRISMTPDRDMTRRLSRISNNFPPLPNKDRLNSPRNSPRNSTCTQLFQSQSQEVFSMGRRSSVRNSSIGVGSPTANKRNLPSKPTMSVEVENMSSDFYISPFDWSRNNVIAFALVDEMIIINPKTMEISNIPDVPDDILSVKFSPFGERLFVGCDIGDGEIYDVVTNELISRYELFVDNSVLVADWKENTIIAGCRDGKMAILDSRDDDCLPKIECAHLEEVCAIKMQSETTYFATSSNDCSVRIWDIRSIENGPLVKYEQHEAAIRAMCWSPTQKELIVTGGGTADKNIKLWNSQTGETIRSIDTGSQVCNLYWNEEYNEIVSTHGYSQNHIALWKATDLSPVASFHTHKERVLYMCVSPDGSTVATAAPNDTMQIWKLFPNRALTVSQSLLLLR